MSELLKLVDEIKRNQDLSVLDLSSHPYNTRAGMEAQKSIAKKVLPVLINDYADKVTKHLVKVFINGEFEQVTSFINLFKKDVPSFYIKSLYEDIAEVTSPKLSSGKEYSAAAYLRTVEMLRAYSETAKLIPHTALKQPVPETVTSFSKLVSIVKDVTRNAFGDALYVSYLRNNTIRQALSEHFDKDVGVVFIVNATDAEKDGINELLFKSQPSFQYTIQPTDIINKGAVQKLHNKINQWKNKTLKTTEETNTKEVTNNE